MTNNDCLASHGYHKHGRLQSEKVGTTEYTYTYDARNELTDITTKVDNVLIKITVYTYDSNDNQQKTVVKTYTSGTTLESTVTTAMLRRYNLQDE